MIITINGIERVGKQYYAGILNRYLKQRYQDKYQIRKFSFPSYTTSSGKKLAELIRRFREDDLLSFNGDLTATRYRRIAGFFLENMKEYNHLVALGANQGDNNNNNISLVSNYGLYSITAHGLAAGLSPGHIEKVFKNHTFSPPDLAFFLTVKKNVRKMLTEPLKTHEIYSSREVEIDPETYSEDYINYFTMVNGYYRQVYLVNALKHPGSKFILVEIDPDSITHITDTAEKVKSSAAAFLNTASSLAGAPSPTQSGTVS